MSNIILQKIAEKKCDEVPTEWRYRDLKKFGLDWELFKYQKQALENIIALLYLLYKDHKQNNGLALNRNKRELFQLYRELGLTQEISDQLDIKEEDKLPVNNLSSIDARKNLILNGLYFLKISYGMGIGAGNFTAYHEKRSEEHTSELQSH